MDDRTRAVASLAVLSALLAVAGSAGAQNARPPKRPKLDAGADTNSAAAYYQFGQSRLANRPEQAADAFYWSARLDPAAPEPRYARWVALLLVQPLDILREYLDGEESVHTSRAVLPVDSLRYQALLREPLLPQKLDGTLVDQYLVRESGGEVGLASVDLTGDPAFDAWLQFARGSYADAARRVSMAIERYPQRLSLHDSRARAFVSALQYDSAAAEFEQLIELRHRGEATRLVIVYQSEEMANYCIGRIREIQGRLDSARAAYQLALTENLGFYPAHVALAQASLAGGDTANALKEYDIAATLITDRPDIRYDYGALLLTRGAFEDAAAQFSLAIEEDSDFARPYYALGYVRESQGKDSVALDLYRRFVAAAASSLGVQIADARRRVAVLQSQLPAH